MPQLRYATLQCALFTTRCFCFLRSSSPPVSSRLPTRTFPRTLQQLGAPRMLRLRYAARQCALFTARCFCFLRLSSPPSVLTLLLTGRVDTPVFRCDPARRTFAPTSAAPPIPQFPAAGTVHRSRTVPLAVGHFPAMTPGHCAPLCTAQDVSVTLTRLP